MLRWTLHKTFKFLGDLKQICWDKVQLVGWSDGGNRVQERCSSSGWILKAVDSDGRAQVVAAGANYYDRVAESSMEVEAKAMRDLWRAIVHLESDPGSIFEFSANRWYTFQNVISPKRRRLRAICVE
eukprot:629481-Karenia_brevis.AAC.1